MIALAVYQEKRWPRARWPPCVPYLNFTVLKEYQEKLGPRAKWTKYVLYLDLKARSKRHERHWPRDQWPKSVQYRDFFARDAFYEKHFPRKNRAEGVPYLNFVALAECVKERDAGLAKVALTSGLEMPPSQSVSWHTSRLAFMQREAPICIPPKPQYDDRFHVELFKKRQDDAEYESKSAKNDAEIKALKPFIIQFDRVNLLVEQSRRDLRSVTVKQWQNAVDGTDILDTSIEAAQYMEFSRRIEVGEINVGAEGDTLVKMFENMRREWC
ncbi:hypothetical protein G6011_00723 [Alternaria panax]|uniref:Uncharacterized protein n=1 Tax=Alternaria panax TaxID=48097 RepID=A0AAD4IJA1_9PLEO|nr:hypothetical protein G6011_00723 [Alternaria panax]